MTFRVKTFQVTSNLGNVRTVIVSASIQNGKQGIKAEIDELAPDESVEITQAMIDAVSR